ncbi:MAG: hypothetical protein WC530_07980 [Candidatus Omnitrophota bacterium]
MSFTRKRNAVIFITVLIAAYIWLPRNGFSEDKRAGLYVGPLSVAVETIVEKVKSASKDVPEQLSGTQQRYRGETGMSKKRATEPETKSPLSSPSTRGNQ